MGLPGAGLGGSDHLWEGRVKVNRVSESCERSVASCQSLCSLLWLERKCPQRLLSGSLGIIPNDSRSCGAEPGLAGRGRTG